MMNEGDMGFGSTEFSQPGIAGNLIILAHPKHIH